MDSICSVTSAYGELNVVQNKKNERDGPKKTEESLANILPKAHAESRDSAHNVQIEVEHLRVALDIMPYLIAGVQIAAGMRTGTKRGIPVLPLRRPTAIKRPRGPPPLPQIPGTEPPQSGGRRNIHSLSEDTQGRPRNLAALVRRLLAAIALRLDVRGLFEGISLCTSTCYIIHASVLLYTIWRAFKRPPPDEEAPPGGDGAPPPPPPGGDGAPPPPHGGHFPPPPPQLGENKCELQDNSNGGNVPPTPQEGHEAPPHGLCAKMNKVVLAYSGGSDTVIVPWLRENYGCEVVCFTADVGQGINELDGLEEKAKASGACLLVVKDLKEEFVKDYIFPCLRAGVMCEREYLLGTSMAGPVIAKAMVDVAKAVGADAVAHGCTGKEHSEIRFEPTFFALDPKLIVVAPWREWDSMGSEDAIGHAKKHNVPVPVSNKSINSRDGNLWCRSREGDTSGEENEPKKDTFMLTVNPEDAPHEAESVDIGIVSGIPVSVNGKKLSPASLLTKLNEIGRRHGIGHMDMFGNCLSRAVYETPGVDILFAAARKLESLTMDQETLQVKDSFAQKYADLVNAGRWFDPLRESVDSFMENISRRTTGTVTLKLNKGLITVTSTCT